MRHAKEITITVTVRLCPDERRAINYSHLRSLYATPSPEAALAATAANRASCKRWIEGAVAHAVEFQLSHYLDARKKASQ